MQDNIEEFHIAELGPQGRLRINQPVAAEVPVGISFNGQQVVTLMASPEDLDCLAAGYLFSEGFIKSKADIRKIKVDPRGGEVALETVSGAGIPQDVLMQRIVTSGCGRGATFRNPAEAEPRVESQRTIKMNEVFSLVGRFQHASSVYAATHGVHSAALADTGGILVFSEDIGRHNAVDKVFGKCLLEGIPTSDRVLACSGRVSSEIMHKIARNGVPIVLSISAPTNLGVMLAARSNITLVCSVKGKTRMKVFTHDWRITGGA